MDSKIKEILEKIDKLQKSLQKEQIRLSKKYGFFIQQKKVIFLEKIKKRNRTFRIPAWKYLLPKNIRHFLSIPFIYSMIIPALVLDIFITIYHHTTFPLYGIPKVKRSDFIIYDRRFLDYLNVIQKIHCLYCSYLNGLLAYSMEIAGRTERYWCPIKSSYNKNVFTHNWYRDFADYGDPEDWKNKFNDHEVFEKK
ncbi:MAG: hypothetical protein IPN70_00120 [Candidatus Moraniibacteriota bacterium]|nr:MAG: hypothetical protein IPN70_00120 [Candidatus Moranbacteria bacterium]